MNMIIKVIAQHSQNNYYAKSLGIHDLCSKINDYNQLMWVYICVNLNYELIFMIILFFKNDKINVER